jgi:hypothetical protein
LAHLGCYGQGIVAVAVGGGGASEEGKKVDRRERTDWLTCWELIMGDCGGLGGNWGRDGSNLKDRVVAVPTYTGSQDADSCGIVSPISNGN